MCVCTGIKISANLATCKLRGEPVISQFLRSGTSLNIPQSGVFVNVGFRYKAAKNNPYARYQLSSNYRNIGGGKRPKSL
jgi:hypothetical protein